MQFFTFVCIQISYNIFLDAQFERIPLTDSQKSQLIQLVAKQIAEYNDMNPQELIQNQQLLVNLYKKNQKEVNWNKIRSKVTGNPEKNILYHYFAETFLRQFDSVSQEDQSTIEQILEQNYENNIPYTKETKAMIESKLTKQYCRATVQKLINNARKKIRRKYNLGSNVSSSVSTKNGIFGSQNNSSASIASSQLDVEQKHIITKDSQESQQKSLLEKQSRFGSTVDLYSISQSQQQQSTNEGQDQKSYSFELNIKDTINQTTSSCSLSAISFISNGFFE